MKVRVKYFSKLAISDSCDFSSCNVVDLFDDQAALVKTQS